MGLIPTIFGRGRVFGRCGWRRITQPALTRRFKPSALTNCWSHGRPRSELSDTLMICPYEDAGEVVEPPRLAGTDRPYICTKCGRRLREKQVIIDDKLVARKIQSRLLMLFG